MFNLGRMIFPLCRLFNLAVIGYGNLILRSAMDEVFVLFSNLVVMKLFSLFQNNNSDNFV